MNRTYNLKLLLASLFLFSITCTLFAQSTEKPFIKLVEPLNESNSVSTSKQFIVGSTCKGCSLKINDADVKVYSTGAFAHEITLKTGVNFFSIEAAIKNKNTRKKISYEYTPPPPVQPVKSFGIEYVKTFPEGDLVVLPGDKIQLKMKAYPGCKAEVNGRPLYELPISSSNKMPGMYTGEYEIFDTDSFRNSSITVSLTDKAGNVKSLMTSAVFTVMNENDSNVAMTKGRLAHLEYGLGDDRLGGAKIGYIDSLIPLKIMGKVRTHYKVRLTDTRTAYIPDEHVTVMPKGTLIPYVLTDKWKVYGDAVFDYVKIGLTGRLPYQSFQLTEPSRIVVDIFGATNNTNWINQLNSVKEIKEVHYEQVSDDIYRITISLKHRQHWGHQIYYEGNVLVIKVKQQSKDLSLSRLTIAIDAGHGGSNTGAGGPTGVAEKTLALALSLKLKKVFEKKGAKIIMTRETETFFDNKERILFYRDSMPDLLLSIHLNSSSDPIRAKGTSTFYRYIGFRPLSRAIYQRMLELGLDEYGNNGSFNFMLNSPTEYPNALIETLFLSNPEEEAKMLDESFQQNMADKIVQGVEDFLEATKKE
ncbi:MAG: N-acetylmuramoyl-L-alanine amidase [Ferruginibacter sp.]|nr:N-acetylmuramoyl-L-alanine amidase [Ferruginibacter sp.]